MAPREQTWAGRGKLVTMMLLTTSVPVRRLASDSRRALQRFVHAFGQFWTGYWQSPPGL